MSNNEPAFPVSDCATMQYHGMTLRDWFAANIHIDPEGPSVSEASALMGACPPVWGKESDLDCIKYWADAEARLRYMKADAMLAERANK